MFFFISEGLAQSATPDQYQLTPLEVTVNNDPGGTWLLLEHDDLLYAPEDAFREWRVTLGRDTKHLDYRGQRWYLLPSRPGFQANRNFPNQSVDLTFLPEAFAATRLSPPTVNRVKLTPATPAVFLNYDLTMSRTVAGDVSAMETGAITELGVSAGAGVLSSSYVARRLSAGDASGLHSWRRLETTFTRDFVDSNVSVRLGDGVTRSTVAGRSIYFAGIQIAKNFELTPGIPTHPLPTIAGTSHAPSTLELYINDTLRQVSTVPAGPFAIENSPLLSGAGEARIVVRDLLGRETVQVQPFFTDLTLLSQGLSDWSVEVGAPRRNLGTESGNYAEPFFSGGARYGMTSNVTAEGGAQVSGSAQAAGVGATLALPWQSLGQASIAASRGSDNTRGYEWILGASHHRSAHGFSLEAQSASRTYRSLGLDSTVSRARALSASYYYTSEKLGSVAFALARVAGHTGFALTSYSANYSLRVGKRGSLAFNFIRVNGTSSGSSAGVALSLPLGGQTTASVGMNHAAGRTDSYMSANQGLTDEIGFAWRALAGTRSKRTYSEGGVSYQGRRALLTGDISAAGGQQTARVGAQGGLVYVDGRFFSSRRLQDSFALVEVPGYPNIGVGFQGGILTRTDEHGVALLPRLLPYQVNRIRLDAADLPINAELDTIEQTVVPAARSAVKIRFPVRPGRGALIKILLDDGEPAPAGAQINIAGDTKTFFVARRGESFVTGLQGKNTLRMAWKRRFCTFSVDLPAGKVDDIARVGPVTCAGIGR